MPAPVLVGPIPFVNGPEFFFHSKTSADGNESEKVFSTAREKLIDNRWSESQNKRGRIKIFIFNTFSS